MNPQDSVERVLKEIHVAFSKSPTYNGQPDKMIVDRKEFLNLLDRLNRGIFDMMEQYEHTRQSRLNAERSFQKTGNEIIAKANASAEEIYAASVIYTSDAISRIRDLMDETNDSMDDLFRRFRREMRDQKNLLKSHETELEAQLADLADTKKYLTVLQDMNREHEKQIRDSGKADRTAGSRSRSGAAVEIKVNEEYFEKTGMPRRETPDDSSAPAEKPDIKVDTNAAYFKWKEEQGRTGNKSAAEQTDAESTESDNVVQRLREHGRDVREEYYDHTPARRLSDDESSEGRETVSPDAVDSSDAADSSDEDFLIHPNPEFPDEESIYRALLEDERELETARREETQREKSSPESSGREKIGAGGVLKTILFGKE